MRRLALFAPLLLLAQDGDWTTYSGNLEGWRYSPLRQITPGNVAKLKPAWMYQVRDLNQFEVTPLVTGGVMYISEPPSNATALELRTGRPLWVYRRNTPGDVRPCCGQVNRGLAMMGDTLFLGTIDAHLVALDAKTGRVKWDVQVADYHAAYTITVAPLVVSGKVIIGVSGGEFGIRGFLDAYDPKTGARVWRFWTVPGPGEPGHETWAGDSWKRGSAATWVTGSFDPATNLLFWGAGNPGPDYNGEVRAGDNLYSNSLLALDPDTGKLRWHFQFTPHDTHDWDANHTPIVVDGRVLVANRNGFFYSLDARTGAFGFGVPYGKQTWAKGLDGRGRPNVLPGTEPSREGTLVYPGLHGVTNWYSASYSPVAKLLYVGVREEGTIYYRGTAEFRPGRTYTGGGPTGIPGVEPSGSIKALRISDGGTAWETPLHSPPWAGVMATAGGVVFAGTNEGHFFALDAANGKPLWRFAAGAPILNNPISYWFDGKQYVATAAGRALIVFSLAE